jgi:hypothetical protein
MRFVGEHFKKDGQPKRTYATRREAIDAPSRGDQKVYRCGFCGGWHRARRLRGSR